MAVTLTQAALSAAIRLGDSAEEVAEATRLLAFATEAISRHLGDAYDTAPEAVVNEASIRLAGYLFDQPNAGRGLSFANAGRNSGAWAILLPYRVHRAGSTGEAVAAAQQAVGTLGNPVLNVAISGGNLVVTFDDGTTRDDPLPADMTTGDGTDQTARAAAAAQADIDAHEATPHNTDTTARDAAAAAQADIDAHEATPHNTDTVARSTAGNARTTAEQAQAGLAAHEASTHNHDAGARTAAANAQSAIEDHERTPHNTDTVARNAAAAAQSAAEAAAAGRPTVLYETTMAAIGGSAGLIAGNVVCPETGALEFYFEGLTGTRQGGVAYARIPAARIRAAESALNAAYNNDSVSLLAIPHGANRGIGIAVQASTNYLMLSAQAPGNFYIRIAHIV